MTKTDKIVNSFLTGMSDLSGEKSKILYLRSEEKIQDLKDKLNEALTIPVVSQRSELLLFDEYIYSNESQHDRDRGGVVDRYLSKK